MCVCVGGGGISACVCLHLSGWMSGSNNFVPQGPCFQMQLSTNPPQSAKVNRHNYNPLGVCYFKQNLECDTMYVGLFLCVCRLCVRA